MGVTLIVGRTAREARDRLEEYRRHASVDAALVHASASLGIDSMRWDRTTSSPPCLRRRSVPMSRRCAPPRRAPPSAPDRPYDPGQPPAPDRRQRGGRGGSADRLGDEAGLDGFNLSRTVLDEGLEEVVRLLVPALQERGRYKRAYAPGTYREKLFGAGPRLAGPHPAAALAR